MITTELKERYKMLPLWGRLVLASLIGSLPGIYTYFDEAFDIQDRLDAAQVQEDAVRQKFERSRQQKSNLPALEERLAFIEDQMAKAKKQLPETILMEDVLQKTATVAKDVGLVLERFEPAPKEKFNVKPYPYAEQPISVDVIGKFAHLASFVDRMVHLDGTLYVQRMRLERYDGEAKNETAKPAAVQNLGSSDGDNKTKITYDAARTARLNSRVKAHFDMVVFRAMTAAETARPAATDGQGANGGKGGKGEAGGKQEAPPGVTPPAGTPGTPNPKPAGDGKALNVSTLSPVAITPRSQL